MRIEKTFRKKIIITKVAVISLSVKARKTKKPLNVKAKKTKKPLNVKAKKTRKPLSVKTKKTIS